MQTVRNEVTRRRSGVLTKTLQVIAGICSLILSILGAGIFLWGSPISHPNAQGVLLCAGPVVSFPAFLTLFFSQKLHRVLVWLVAVVSGTGAFTATLAATTTDHPASRADITNAMHSLLLPLVLLSFAVVVLVELSYWTQNNSRSSQG